MFSTKYLFIAYNAKQSFNWNCEQWNHCQFSQIMYKFINHIELGLFNNINCPSHP